MDRNANIAVVGATGAVGQQLLSALAEAGHPAERVTALASERSVGTEVEYGGETLEVEQASADSFRGMQGVLVAVPNAAAKGLAQSAQAAGAWVVDVSDAFASDPHVPVVVPGVNGSVLERPFQGRITRCPSAVTAALATVLEPLRAAYGLNFVGVTALMGASAHGLRGVQELEQQTANLLSGRELEPALFPHRLAFNVIPQVGAFAGSSSGEEEAWRRDLTRLFGPERPFPLEGTAVLVPIFFGHALSLTVKLGKGAEVAEVRAKLQASRALKVLDDPAQKVYPMPLLVTADPTVLVGRVRAGAGLLDTVSLFAAVDNVGRGAALNAIETLSLLLRRG